MTLKPRGDESESKPQPKGLPDFSDYTAEQVLDEIREIGGNEAVRAVEWSVLAIQAYNVYLESGDEKDAEAFFAVINKIYELPAEQVKTVLASGIAAMVEVRNRNKGE